MKIVGEIIDYSDNIKIDIAASFDDSCYEASWALESIQIEIK
jgi:hypothetical protein